MSIVWLASYPKSGNTWIRVFLSALENQGTVDLERLSVSTQFASRADLDHATDLDSAHLYEQEARALMPEVYRTLAAKSGQTLFVKIHDAFSRDPNGVSLIPEDVSRCALYVIRNPLDIVGSLANHSQISLAQALEFMLDDEQYASPPFGNINTGDLVPQSLRNWEEHVQSWTMGPRFPVHVIRYEDLLSDAFSTFKTALQAIGYSHFTDEQVRQACKACRFEALKEQEQHRPFRERLKPGASFFRKGRAGGWEEELTTAQADQVVAKYGRLMKVYGYL